MCGIIGVLGQEGGAVRTALVELLLQSQIRGQHATGISYLQGGKLVTLKAAVPAKAFIETIPADIGTVVIGHTRYSTSNIEYNQPLQEGATAIVHNGVITQLPFRDWSEKFKIVNFSTKNDSEILLKSIVRNEYFNEFESASIAAGWIKDGELYCFRNGQRPLYRFTDDVVIGFASTANIIKRAFKGKEVCIEPHEPFTVCDFYTDLSVLITRKHDMDAARDLQLNLVSGATYLKGGGVGTGL